MKQDPVSRKWGGIFFEHRAADPIAIGSLESYGSLCAPLCPYDPVVNVFI